MDRKFKNTVFLCALVLFLGLVYLLWRYPLAESIDNAHVANLIEELGWLGIPAFLLSGTLATAVGLPRQLVSFIGGYSFGVFAGVSLGTLAAIGGCFLCFAFSRYFLQAAVSTRYVKTVSMLNKIIRQDAFLKIIVLRLQPFGTNLITNLSAGVSQIPARVFIASSFIGYIPQMLVFALMGAGVRMHSKTQLVVSALLFVLSLVIGWYLYRRHRVAIDVR